MKYFLLRQNNSFGLYKGPAVYVIIGANTETEAQRLALKNDIYFDGVSKGIDCDCCGDRWYWPMSWDDSENWTPEPVLPLSEPPYGDLPLADCLDHMKGKESDYLSRRAAEDGVPYYAIIK